MKERVSALESEVGGLTAQLSAYAPDTASLRENVFFCWQHEVTWSECHTGTVCSRAFFNWHGELDIAIVMSCHCNS